MKTKHTPGPWATEDGYEIWPTTGKNQLCSFCFMPKSGIFPADEMKANAQLIAAAPDLLNALLTMKWLCECDIQDHKNGLCQTDKYGAVRLRDVILPSLQAAGITI